MIAMAIACNPKLIIADEPTTALDVTIQAQILELLLDLQKETGTALVLITHDMGVVAETAERVAVFYSGQKVEEQPVGALFADPHHPYTAALLAALPERAVGRLLPSIPGVVPGQFNVRPDACSRRVASSPPAAASRRCRRGRARSSVSPSATTPWSPASRRAIPAGRRSWRWHERGQRRSRLRALRSLPATSSCASRAPRASTRSASAASAARR